MPRNMRSKALETANEDADEAGEGTMLIYHEGNEEDGADAANDVSSGDILKAINGLKMEFSTKLDGVLSAIQDIKNDVKSCANRVTQAEERISGTEDSVSVLQASVKKLETEVRVLTSRVEDQDNRSRRSNLRLINLPEGAEGKDACAFMESWLPEALGIEPLRSPLIIERCHRLPGPKKLDRNGGTAPKALIMKFLNFKDKVLVQEAARRKGKVLYKNYPVMFFPDLSAEVHKQRRRYDGVKQKLRAMGVRYGIVFPARLRVSHGERTYMFENPSEAEHFVERINKESQPGIEG